MSRGNLDLILGQPAWDVARLFPNQGAWSVEEYFQVSDGNRLVEFTDGAVEVLPMPTMNHQLMVLFLLDVFRGFVGPNKLGTVLFAPFRVRIREGKYREPDLGVMLRANAGRMTNEYWHGADLVVEVVSETNPERDLVTKPADYAEAGIPEYWIVDPRGQQITVLVLEPGATAYVEHGRFGRGQKAVSRLLPGLEVDVNAVLDVKPLG